MQELVYWETWVRVSWAWELEWGHSFLKNLQEGAHAIQTHPSGRDQGKQLVWFPLFIQRGNWGSEVESD